MVGSLLWEMRGFLSPRVLFDTVTLPRESAAEQPLHRFVTRMSSNYIRWCTPRNLRRRRTRAIRANEASAPANKDANAEMVAQLCRTAAALASPHRNVALCYMPNDFVRKSLNETVSERWCKRHRNDGSESPLPSSENPPLPTHRHSEVSARTQHYIQQGAAA